MRSADRQSAGSRAALAVCVAAAGLAAGCTTTMQKAARVQLNSARERVAQSGVRVSPHDRSTAVRVTRVQVASSGAASAYVVSVHNVTGRVVSDLPVSVGFTLGHTAIYLNAGTGLAYFQAHLPAVPAGQTLSWVFVTSRRLPAGVRPFAIVGARTDPPASANAVPRIEASLAGDASGARVSVRLRNLSGIPQFQLPVYAITWHLGHVVAAGTTSIAALLGGGRQVVSVPLVSSGENVGVTTAAAPATILK